MIAHFALSMMIRPGRPPNHSKAPVAGQPRLDGLVQHDLGVLVARPAQRHDEDPRSNLHALDAQHGTGAEVDLYRVGRSELQDHRGGHAALGGKMPDHAADCRVAAGVAVSAAWIVVP